MAQRLSDIPETVRLSDVPEERDPLVEKMAAIDAAKKATASAEPGAGEYLWNRAKKGLAGFMGVPGDLIDATRDMPLAPHPALIPLRILIDRAAEKMGLRVTKEMLPTKKVIATSDLYRDALGVDPKMTTTNDGLRYAGGVVEMGAAAAPFGLVMKAAAIPSLITGAVGSGIGLEAGGDVAEGFGFDRNTGEAVGAFAGGIIPAVAGAATSRGVDAAKGRFSKGAQIAGAEREALDEVRANIDQVPASGINLERSNRVAGEFAKEGVEFTPSLPARTNSPGLLAIEKNLVTTKPEALNRAVKNAEDVQLQIADFIDAKYPVTKAEPAAKRVQDIMKASAVKLDGMKKAVDNALDDMTLRFDRQPNDVNGEKLRGLFMKQKLVYRGMRDAKYTDVYKTAEQLGVRDNIDDVVKYVDDTLKTDLNAYQQSDIPSVFREVQRKFGAKPAPETGRYVPPDLMAEATKGKAADLSFEELHSLYKRTNSDLASLRGSMAPDKDFKIRLLENMKTMLKGKVDAYQDTAFGPVAEKLKAANSFYEAEYLPRFKQGFGGDISAKYGTGEFRTPAERVTELVTKPNNIQAAKDFKLLFDDVPEAWNALRDGYMDNLFRNAGVVDANGRIKQTALDSYIRKNAGTLDQFPQIKRDIQRLSTDNAGLLERQARVAAQQKELHAAELFKMFNGGDAGKILESAITEPKAMRLLASQAKGNPERAKAFARSIAEQVMTKDDPLAFFQKNEEAIRSGLSPLGAEHWKNMRTAMEAVGISQRTMIPQMVQRQSIAPDTLLGSTGNSLRSVISSARAVQHGRSGVLQEGSFLLGRMFESMKRDHKMVVLESIFYDPDTSKVMANLGKNPASPKARSDFMTQMVKLGVKTAVAGQE